MMQMKTNLTAHHQLTDAQPVSQQQPPGQLSPGLYADHDIIWPGLSLWSVGVSCPTWVPSQLLVHPQPPRWQGHVRSLKGLDAV